MLAYFLFAMGIVMFMLYVIYTGLVARVPWLYRLPSPLYYGMFPAAYLYAVMMVYDRQKFPARYLWHFLPVLLHLLEMMPYYLTSLEYKSAHTLESLRNPIGGWAHNEGLLSDYWHNILRGLQALIYGLLIVRLISRVKKIRSNDYQVYIMQIRWLFIFGLSVALFGGYLVTLLVLRNHLASSYYLMLLLGCVAVIQIFPAYYIIANSSILLGMPITNGINTARVKPAASGVVATANAGTGPELEVEQANSVSKQKVSDEKLSPAQYRDYLEKLQGYMDDHKPFLKPRYTSGELAKDVGIPQYHLTYLLSQVLNERFNDYINRHRIAYIKNSLEKETLNRLTLEALANSAGFGSRVTFIRAVQKHTGQNPSQYFNVEDDDH